VKGGWGRLRKESVWGWLGGVKLRGAGRGGGGEGMGIWGGFVVGGGVRRLVEGKGGEGLWCGGWGG